MGPPCEMLRRACIHLPGTPTLSAGRTAVNCFLLGFTLTFGEMEGDCLPVPPRRPPQTLSLWMEFLSQGGKEAGCVGSSRSAWACWNRNTRGLGHSGLDLSESPMGGSSQSVTRVLPSTLDRSGSIYQSICLPRDPPFHTLDQPCKHS